MHDLLRWFEAHPGLAGYVQTLGSLIALLVAIRMPTWQRRPVERAAELSFGSVLNECYSAVSLVESLVDDDELDHDPDKSGPSVTPDDIVQRLERAVARLDCVSLFEFNPKCAALIQKLQSKMLEVAQMVRVYVDWGAEGASLDLYDLDQDEVIYRLMLKILEAMNFIKDRELAATLRRQLGRIDQRNAERPRPQYIRRVIVTRKPTLAEIRARLSGKSVSTSSAAH
ncbi:MAG: hypothetical protein AB7T59_06285 [Hyphomonadaceae bacterium]